MIRSAHALIALATLGTLCFAQNGPAQAPPANNNAGDVYYHFAMGRLYKEMGEARGSRSDITKAIQNYELALKEDPKSEVILDDLTELYLATNRYQDAITEADDLLKQNPDNIGARRML